jgi:c-di-GMP-binding flagellar brake protein YcgR
MPPIVVNPNKPIELAPMEGRGELNGHLMDVEPDAWLIKAPELFAGGKEVPEYIELAFGHQNFFWRVPAEIKASYAPWIFVKPPEEEDARRFQRRSFVRVALSSQMLAIPITSGGQPRGAAVKVDVHNLSAGGCLATCGTDLGQAGDYVLMAMDIPGLGQVGAPSQLVRKQDNRYGIHFHGLKGTPRDGVARYITDQIAFHLQRGRDITLPQP